MSTSAGPVSTTLDRWHERIEAEYRAELERGEHDEDCESRPRSRLCHCAKRRRVAAGHVDLPGELVWNLPSCPRCWNDVHHDGDGFTCETCAVSFANDGTALGFTDDYGDLNAPPPSQQIAAARSAAGEVQAR